MLKQISVDTVKQAADLAYEAVADRQRFLAGMRNIDLGEQSSERGSRNPTDLDALSILSSDASGALNQLQKMLEDLTPEQRMELRAVMFVGRGDFAGNQWDRALDEAGRAPDATHYTDIAERIDLHDDLMKGLYELDLLKKKDGQ
ncbi:hypothetical protein TSH58p_14515 [Azospirillum sp. TSH58]|uniref:DUF3775 domain-containing protein n=1 Tax=Azospirillum sp. TSH58 TaxID=664962 RepID=UPI000D600FA3|nr:DUF3775 domain-containing protein [Azospirillum sp. TSH58]AWJ84632.1 hypothetical protein TSH58p_14515 [Azospirillum sp. TSH58]PWC70213.1 hypothetical protein TSH58_13845 [Azospirillum sp. TSH58]